MKNKIFLFFLLIFIFILLINKAESKVYNNDNSIIYAVLLDGVEVNKIPQKGLYNVIVNCENVTGKWLYDEWKLQLTEMQNEKVLCSLDFTTIANKTYLNEYITDLVTNSPDQGTGKLVHEYAIIDNSYYAALSEGEYIVTSNDTTNSSGTVDNTLGVWTYNSTSNAWESQNKTNSTVGTISFTVSAGEYKLCYTMSSEQNYDYAIIKIDDVIQFNTKGKNTTSFICNDLGSLTADNIISVSYSKDSSQSKYNDQVVFYLTSEDKYVEDIQTVDAGIRYEGKNPNNYVWFNNELWRIIGVFDEETHGQNGDYLVKIIRNKSIGGLIWDTSQENNNWSTSSLKKILNESYYDYKTYGYDANGCMTYCNYYYGNYSSEGSCDYSLVGISDAYRPMIKNVTWHLRGTNTAKLITEDMFLIERFYGSVSTSSYPVLDTGYIGLIYPSDYGFSVLESDCARSTNLESYGESCANYSWLYGNGDTWTISQLISTSSSKRIMGLYSTGNFERTNEYLYEFYVSDGYSTFPSLYLDSSIFIYEGTGTITDPYIIGM